MLLKAQIAQLQAQIDQLKAKVDSLNGEVDSLTDRLVKHMVNDNHDGILALGRINTLQTDVEQLKSITGWLYTQQNANRLRTCTVRPDKLRQALRDHSAVSVDVDCN